nr:EOG090X08BF [Lepidurus arcticus]
MSASKFDQIYRSILLSRFFTKGWGKPEDLQRLFKFRKIVSNRDTCYQLVRNDHPVHVLKDEVKGNYRFIQGCFQSPFVDHLPGLLPAEAVNAHFQLLLPLESRYSHTKPICIHLAGTGDHYFWRRRLLMATPLLKDGIGSLLLENPFYGLRKPRDQVRSCLHNVSDIFVMGGCLVLESLALLHWAERQGLGPFGITGISMGGYMASLAATNWPQPMALVPCLSWSTASAVFTHGVMSGAIDWELLQRQYASQEVYREVIAKMVSSPEDVSFAHCVAFLDVLKPRISSGNDDGQEFSANAEVELDKDLREKALAFMRGIMDECTHLANFSLPVDPECAIIVAARHDAYVPRQGILRLDEIWPGAEVRYLDSGHTANNKVSSGISWSNLWEQSWLEECCNIYDIFYRLCDISKIAEPSNAILISAARSALVLRERSSGCRGIWRGARWVRFDVFVKISFGPELFMVL